MDLFFLIIVNNAKEWQPQAITLKGYIKAFIRNSALSVCVLCKENMILLQHLLLYYYTVLLFWKILRSLTLFTNTVLMGIEPSSSHSSLWSIQKVDVLAITPQNSDFSKQDLLPLMLWIEKKGLFVCPVFVVPWEEKFFFSIIDTWIHRLLEIKNQ